jgi:hypothetical protein
VQVQQRQNLGDLRGTSRPCGQDRRGEPLPLAGFRVRPLVVHPRRFQPPPHPRWSPPCAAGGGHCGPPVDDRPRRPGRRTASTYAATSACNAAASIFRAPSRTIPSINDRSPPVPPSDSSPPRPTLSLGTYLPTRRWRARLDQTCESDHPRRYSLPAHPQVLIIALLGKNLSNDQNLWMTFGGAFVTVRLRTKVTKGPGSRERELPWPTS